MVKNPPANAGDTGSIPGLGGPHMPWSNEAQVVQLVRQSSRACACVLSRFSHVQILEAPWTVARQAPLSMGFSMQEYWSGLPCPPPGGLPKLGIKPVPLASPALAGRFFTNIAIC